MAWSCENNYGRNQLKSLFSKLTDDSDFWTKLEYRMDYVTMLKHIKFSHPQYNIDEESLINIERFRRDIKNMLRGCLLKAKQKEYLLSLGCTPDEFEGVYSRTITKFQELEKYKQFKECSYFSNFMKMILLKYEFFITYNIPKAFHTIKTAKKLT